MKGVRKLLSRQQRNTRPTGLRELALLDNSDDKRKKLRPTVHAGAVLGMSGYGSADLLPSLFPTAEVSPKSCLTTLHFFSIYRQCCEHIVYYRSGVIVVGVAKVEVGRMHNWEGVRRMATGRGWAWNLDEMQSAGAIMDEEQEDHTIGCG